MSSLQFLNSFDLIREELLFTGQVFLEAEDWPLLNDYDIAAMIGIHDKDFKFYFGSKKQFEIEVLELYADQHLLDTKTLLSCCFRRPIKRVKKYLVYLTEEYTSKQKMIDMLFYPFAEGIQHRSVSNRFLVRLTNLLAACLEETFEANRIDLKYLETYSREIIESHLSKLKKMNREESHSFSQRIHKDNELLAYPVEENRF